MHYDIECFYNDCEVEVEEDNVEWNYFEKFEADSTRGGNSSQQERIHQVIKNLHP